MSSSSFCCVVEEEDEEEDEDDDDDAELVGAVAVLLATRAHSFGVVCDTMCGCNLLSSLNDCNCGVF